MTGFSSERRRSIKDLPKHPLTGTALDLNYGVCCFDIELGDSLAIHELLDVDSLHVTRVLGFYFVSQICNVLIVRSPQSFRRRLVARYCAVVHNRIVAQHPASRGVIGVGFLDFEVIDPIGALPVADGLDAREAGFGAQPLAFLQLARVDPLVAVFRIQRVQDRGFECRIQGSSTGGCAGADLEPGSPLSFSRTWVAIALTRRMAG